MIKDWRIIKEVMRAIIRNHFPGLPDSEVERILEEIEKECQGLNVKKITGYVYGKSGR